MAFTPKDAVLFDLYTSLAERLAAAARSAWHTADGAGSPHALPAAAAVHIADCAGESRAILFLRRLAAAAAAACAANQLRWDRCCSHHRHCRCCLCRHHSPAAADAA